MRITSIEIAGRRTGNGKGMPRAFARIGRKLDGDDIEATILTPSGEKTLRARADDEDEMWAMAERVQLALDGARGTNSMINDIYREIQRISDI